MTLDKNELEIIRRCLHSEVQAFAIRTAADKGTYGFSTVSVEGYQNKLIAILKKIEGELK